MRMKKLMAICLAIITIGASAFTVQAANAKYGETNAQVRYIQTALKNLGHFDYPEITGYYGDVTKTAVKSFQKAAGLAVTGAIDDVTLARLQAAFPETKMGAAAKMGALDWFKVVQYVFPREGDAVVIDVDTGKKFEVRRTFGHNHADIEPLTKADAAIIKEIWGGTWNWTRRAVVVIVGEYVMAGSMTAFPHAGRDDKPALAVVSNLSGGYGTGQNLDSVKGNGVDGHMDIHFLNSLTHGTNVKQKVHQDAVAKAAAYIAQHADDFTVKKAEEPETAEIGAYAPLGPLMPEAAAPTGPLMPE